MSSFDLTRRGFAVLAAGFLAACQVRPVYMPMEGGGTVVAALGAIAIEPQTSRVGQELMNALIFELRGGAALADPPLYSLHLIVTTNVTDLTIVEDYSVPGSRLVSLTASYTLTEKATGRAVTTGSVNALTSYDFSSQRFSNLRAVRDAENKVAAKAATEIRTRLSMVLSQNG